MFVVTEQNRTRRFLILLNERDEFELDLEKTGADVITVLLW